MPKIIDHDQRRREIIEVATQIILKGGFEAATMRSIAAEAGFANGALKHYFPGKDSIVAATFESILAQLESTVNMVEASDETERLEAYLRAPIPQDLDQVSAGRVLLALWEYAMSNDDLAQLYRRHLTTWQSGIVNGLTRAREAGVITAEPPYERWANEYISVVIGGVVVNLMYPGGDRLADGSDYLESLLRVWEWVGGPELLAPGSAVLVAGAVLVGGAARVWRAPPTAQRRPTPAASSRTAASALS